MPKWAHKDEDECDNGGNITRLFFFFFLQKLQKIPFGKREREVLSMQKGKEAEASRKLSKSGS